MDFLLHSLWIFIYKEKFMNNLQRKHILVKLANNYEGVEFIKLLENNGLTNIQNITF